jgi:hypothetical protein
MRSVHHMKFYWFTLLFLIAGVAKGQNGGNADDCGARATIDNKFGEEISSYTKRTVVYVYDFYQEKGQGKFYKVRLKGSALDAQAVDLNAEHLKPGADVYLKVVNINKLMYDISVGTATAASEPQPMILRGRDLYGDSLILRSWLDGIDNDDPDIQQLIDDAHLRRLYLSFDYFIDQYSRLDQRVVDAYDPCHFAPCCEQVHLPSLDQLVDEVLEIKARAMDIAVLSDKVSAVLKTTKAVVDACQKTKNRLDTLSKLDTPTKAQLNEIADLNKKICQDADVTANQAKITRLTAMLASLNKVTALLARLPTEGDLKKMIIFLENMVKSNQETLIRLEVGPNGLCFNLNIQARDSVVIPLSLPRNPPVNIQQFIPVIGKAQLSFSLGPFSGLPKYLSNTTYAWQQLANNVNTVQPGANYILVQSGYTHPALGMAAMTNVEWKVCRSVGLGLSGGAGLSVEQNPRLAGLAGGSLFLGNWRQLVITAGVAGIAINRLTNDWQTVADKQVIYTTQPALSYYKELRVGGFVSMTFTPFPLRKKN